MLGDSGLGVFHFPFEIGEFLVENGEPGPAGHVERVEEVGDPLDGRRDHFDVFAIRPILLNLSLNLVVRPPLRHGASSRRGL